MFKLVVFCVFFAAAAAKPGVLLTSPVSTLTRVVSPGVVTYPNTVYSAPWNVGVHLIKKRSPQVPITYVAPNTFLTTSPLATTYTAPIYTASALPALTVPVTTAHLIKKRSAPLLSTTYVAPTTYTATTPLVASTYTATSPLITTPYLTSTPLISQPLTYSTHFIKKRSASAQSAYIVPTAFSHQSRVDLNAAPWVSAYSSPVVYSAGIPTAVSHII